MTPLAFHNWIATTLVFGPSVASVLAERRRFRRDLRKHQADPTYWPLQVCEIAALALAAASAEKLRGAALPGNEWLWPALGCVVSSAGVGLRLWAIRTLGEHFTRRVQVTEGQMLVRGGPYRYLRHPSYTGAILMIGGIGIGLGNVVSVVASSSLTTLGFVGRIRHEEALLHKFFGAEYAEYARRTQRLIPRVW